MRDNDNLPLTLLGDLDDVAKVAGAAVHLDLVVEELLETGGVEDLVGRGLGRVDHELRNRVSLFRGAQAGIKKYLVRDLLLLILTLCGLLFP